MSPDRMLQTITEVRLATLNSELIGSMAELTVAIVGESNGKKLSCNMLEDKCTACSGVLM